MVFCGILWGRGREYGGMLKFQNSQILGNIKKFSLKLKKFLKFYYKIVKFWLKIGVGFEICN